MTAPTLTTITATLGQDPMGQVERAQVMFEKGPITAIAGFFAIAFFVALYLLLRAKDKHQEAVAELYEGERERAVKHEVTMSNYLDMMDDVRFIAFEMRRVKTAREKRKKPFDEGTETEAEGENDG